jgi:dephospho-CoA kinase
MRQVLILAGKARSGKDTVADFLVKEFGFKKFVFSSVLEKELKEKGIKATKKNMSLLGDELREKFGMNVLAKKLLEKVKEEKKLVFVGARSLQEVELIKKRFPEAKLILIEANEKKRFERKSEMDSSEFRQFLYRDEIDSKKKGMNKLIETADFKLENNSSLSDLFQKTRHLMYNIFKE